MPSFTSPLVMTIICLSVFSNAAPLRIKTGEITARHDHTLSNLVDDSEFIKRAIKPLKPVVKPLPKPVVAPVKPPAPVVAPAKPSAPVVAPAKPPAPVVPPSKPLAPAAPPSKPPTTPPKTTAASPTSVKATSTPAVSSAPVTSKSTSASSAASSSASSSASGASSVSSSAATALPTQSTGTLTGNSTGVSAGNSTGIGADNSTDIGASCPVNPSTKPTKKPTVTKRLADLQERAVYEVRKLLGRVPAPAPTAEEFVGFHGTNSDTATLWESSGKIVKPAGSKGLLDFLGLTSTKGNSGADAELGPGLYISDELFLAKNFADINARKNAGATGKVCAIYAKTSQVWRDGTPKAMFPFSVVGDSADAVKAQKLEDARVAYLQSIKAATDGVRFSVFQGVPTGQMAIPERLNFQFSAKCFDSSAVTLDATTGNAVVPAGTLPAGAVIPGPDELFGSQTRRNEWNIKAEDEAKAKAVSVKGCF